MNDQEDFDPSVQGSPAPEGRRSSSNSKQDASRIRRRNRMITSCLECRRRKLKCDKLHPCTNCSKFNRDCVFLAPALDNVSQQKLTELKEKMGSLERVLEQDVALKREKESRSPPSRKTSKPLHGQDDSEEDEVAVPENEKGLEITPLAVQDAAYEDDADDDIVDLGFKFGKMRVTERIGGFFRPKMAEELTVALNDEGATRPTPAEHAGETRTPLKASLSPSDSFIQPGPTFIAPQAGFFFGMVGQNGSFMDYLPSRLAADRLMQQYRVAVHPIARVVFWPSLQLSYDNFWTNVSMGVEPSATLQALVFTILFSAAVSMPEELCMSTFGVPNRTLVENFQRAAEMALSKANFLRTTKIETLQALVIYIIPMCRDELSRAHCGLVSAAVRSAECMGLHRDPTHYGRSPLDVHVRRLLWYQLGILDIRTCEAFGPRPLIRRDEFDTELPLNIDESDLVSVPDPTEQNRWTDMTFMRIRFECNEMNRVIWVERVRLDKKQITLTHLLGKVEAFRRGLEERYLPMLDGTHALQRLARVYMSLSICKSYIMVLHRYHYSLGEEAVDRPRQLLHQSGCQSLEDAVEIATNPDLALWVWYSGAFQQYHVALLLLVEVWSYPMVREADRIWKLLDYVFDANPGDTRPEKGRKLLTELRDKLSIYHDVRKMRTPLSLIKHVHGRAKGPGAYEQGDTSTSSRAESSSPLTTRPPPEIPLNFGLHKWQPVRFQDQQDLPTSSASPSHPTQMQATNAYSSAEKAASSNWSFDSARTNYVGSIGWLRGKTPMTTGAQNGNMPDDFTPTSEGMSIDEGVGGLGFGEMAGMTSSLPQTQPGVSGSGPAGLPPTTMSVVNDIDWHEWDKLFPPNIQSGMSSFLDPKDPRSAFYRPAAS